MSSLEGEAAVAEVSPPGVVSEDKQLQESFSSRVKDVFQRFCKSSDSDVSSEELQKVLRMLNPNFSDQDVQAFASEVSKGGDGKISLRAFMEWLRGGSRGAQKVAKTITAAAEKRNIRIKETFESYDKSGDGSLDISEMRAVMKTLGSFTNEEVRRATEDLDKSQDGEVSFQEFADWIRAPSTSKEIAKAKAILAPSDDDGLEAVYYNFCGPGKADMDGKSFAKLCKDSGVLDSKLPHTEVDIIFAKVKQGKERTIEFHQFENALEKLAQKKGVPVDTIRSTVLTTSRPITKGTTAQANRFYDDHTGEASPMTSTATTSPPRKVVTLKKVGSPDGAVAALMRTALKQSTESEKDVDNRELWRVFGGHSKAGRVLKRIYSDANLTKSTSTMNSSAGMKGSLRSNQKMSSSAVSLRPKLPPVGGSGFGSPARTVPAVAFAAPS
mmetsp:Transcript_52227/g.124522  ORF Transcript_52227/g.124522 Transcript_52227/m.124522 type:complete len:441 (+) Transcript_52227:62-1384(+)